MSNKTRYIVVSAVMILFFLGFSVWNWLKPADAFSDSERRGLAQFPSVTTKQVVSGNFMTEFETYTLDQFPLRDAFRTIKAVVNHYIFRQSDHNGIYLKDGYISKMEYPFNEKSFAYAAKRLGYVYDKYLKDTEVKTYFAIIPDKNYYLNDGAWLKMDYDKLEEQMTDAMPYATYIDIMDSLSLGSYYRTDTHWRQEQIYPAAKQIAEEMGTLLSAEYEKKELSHDFYGVYYGQAALPMTPDSMLYLTNDVLENAKVYDHQNQKEIDVYDMEKATGKDPYEMFLGGPLSLVTIENEQATTEKELVVFRDSFGSSIVPFFVEGYRKITMVDIRYIHPNMLENFIVFKEQDVLFLYSTMVLNQSEVMK